MSTLKVETQVTTRGDIGCVYCMVTHTDGTVTKPMFDDLLKQLLNRIESLENRVQGLNDREAF